VACRRGWDALVSWPEPVHDRRHPPAEEGNELALKHGAYSPRRVEPLAAELVDRVRAMVAADEVRLGYLLEPQFSAALWAWARCEARVQLLEEYLLDESVDGLDLDGEVVPAAMHLERLERRALKLRERLGLDPLSRARLGRDVVATAVDVARVMAETGDAGGITPSDDDVVDVDDQDDEEGDGG
jgi:hypothetical protein